jgi:phosphoglycerate dehydrogenase-like enzyme
MNTKPERVVFLDQDHVLRFIRSLLDARDREAAVADFLAPEQISDIDLDQVTAGLSQGPDLDVVQAAPTDTLADLDPTVVVLRRGSMDGHAITGSPRLRLIQRLGQRTRGIDLETAHCQGVAVSCLSRLSLVSVAEHVVLLTLALARRLVESDSAVRTGRRRPTPAPDSDGSIYNWAGIDGITTLYGKTLGIIGLGEVGLLVAERANALGMHVMHHDRTRTCDGPGSTWQPLEDLLGQSHVVSLHVPGAHGDPVIDAHALAHMRPDAFLINTSRGYLVDEDALHQALISGQIAAAALDVHAHEPRRPDRFTTLGNVVLTPHVAAGSRRAVVEEASAIFANIRAVLDGEQPAHGLTGHTTGVPVRASHA